MLPDVRTSEPRLLSRLLAPITEVRPGEATTGLLLSLNVFLLLTAYYLIKPAREALILASAGAESKSYLSAAIAVALLFAVPAYARLFDRWRRIVLLLVVTLSFAVQLVLFFAASFIDSVRPYLGYIFYVWVGIFNMMIVAQFFSFAADLYSEDQGKRLLPLVVLGSAVGAVTGSAVAGILIEWLHVFPMLLVAALLLSLCALLFWVVDRRQPDRGERNPALAAARRTERHGAFQLVFSQRYLLLVAGFALVFSCVNTNGEYILSKLVVGSSEGMTGKAREDYIGGYYANFFFYVNTATLLLQSLLVSRLVRWFGFGPTFLFLPVLAFVNAGMISVVPALGVVLIAKVAENSVDYSLNNSLRQILWLVTSREMKYKAKQAVDTFFVRMGDVLSAGFVGLSVWLLSGSVRAFVALNAGLALVWAVLALLIGRDYARRRRARGEAGAEPAAASDASPGPAEGKA